jgi:hypothetical protein
MKLKKLKRPNFNWRKLYAKEKDPYRRGRILRWVADHTKSRLDLIAVLDRVECERSEKVPDFMPGEAGNIAWAVKCNPASGNRVRDRAAEMYEHIWRPNQHFGWLIERKQMEKRNGKSDKMVVGQRHASRSRGTHRELD